MRAKQFKCVFVREPETQRYTPVAHNLTAQEATDRLQALSDEGRTGKVIDQHLRHRSKNPLTCKSCKALAERESQDTSAEPVATT